MCLHETVKNIDPERDQSKVKETIELAQKFLDRKIITQYKPEVIKIQTACYEQLVDYELGVVNFYLKNNNLAITQRRLEYSYRTNYKSNTVTPKVLQYEITLAERKHDDALQHKKKWNLRNYMNIDNIESLPP